MLLVSGNTVAQGFHADVYYSIAEVLYVNHSLVMGLQSCHKSKSDRWLLRELSGVKVTFVAVCSICLH